MGDCTANSRYIKKANQSKTIDHTKGPLALVKRQKWHTYCKIIDKDCAYACAPHKVWVKWTNCQAIAKVK